MKLRDWVLLLSLVGLGVGAFGLARAKAVRRARLDAAASVTAAEPETHKVTPAMLASAAGHVKTVAPSFRRTDAEGRVQDLGDLLRGGPIVLIFIKDGCPCSVSASPYFNDLHRLYRGRLRFLGVIEGDDTVARRWGSANHVQFPIVPDAGLEIARSFGVTNSAFVALIDPEGRIDELWPGYSATMLQDLNRRAAALSGLTAQPFDAGEAPEALYSGCPF